MLSKKIGSEAFSVLAADPVAFVRAFDREPWDYQQEILRRALARRDDGKFEYRVVVVSMPRQNGKSLLSAWAALWRLFTDPEPQEVISVALDRASAGIILGDARRIIAGSEILYSLLDRHGLSREEIRLKNGNRWIVKSADSVYSRGLRPSQIAYDELGWAMDRDLFDVLSAGQAAQKNPLVFITSTVGAIKAGPLWELFEQARAGDPGLLLIYDTENKSPLITEEYIERQRALMPAPVFAREHQNLWGEGSEAFCTEGDWQRAIGDGDPRRSKDAGPTWAFLDLGWVHDEAVLAVAAKSEESGKTEIIALESWQGSQSHPVEFKAVESTIRKLAERLHIQKLEIESPQGVQLSQRLTVKGLQVEIVHPTMLSNRERWGALYTALKNGSVLLPNDAVLRRQLLTLTIQNTAAGWKVTDVPAIHNDRAVACAGAVYLATSDTSGEVRVWPNVFYDFDGYDVEEDFLYAPDGKFTFAPGHAVRHSPGASSWRDCRHRMKGCEACMRELTAEGWFDRDKEFEHTAPMSEDEFYMLREQYRSHPRDTIDRSKQHEFLREFWKRVRES